MAKCVIRDLKPDGKFVDREVSIGRMEEFAGGRLDRRRSYALVYGRVCQLLTYSTRCSGCAEDRFSRGCGCRECGYTGRRRHQIWVTVDA